jgi:hypothetical protein
MKLKSILLVATLFVLSAFAGAQNFSNNYFSATFAGPVTVDNVRRNNENTSSEYVYEASTNNVYQTIDVRLVDHDIPVGLSSTEWYANDQDAQMAKQFPGAVEVNRSNGVYQGHPFTYICIRYTYEGTEYTQRRRMIYISQREVYFITQTSRMSYDDNADFATLEQLNIIR